MIQKTEFKELEAMGYRVHWFKWWHCRIKKAGYDDYHLDVFPTTRVWCLYCNDRYVGKGEYADVVALAEEKLDLFSS